MEILTTVVLVFMVTFTIFGVVDMVKKINNLPNENKMDKTKIVKGKIKDLKK
jgi:hypothetical protein